MASTNYTTLGATPYTVKSGDTLSAIGKQYGVDYNTITGYKSGDPNKISVGEVLSIPGKTPAPTPAPAPTSQPTGTNQGMIGSSSGNSMNAGALNNGNGLSSGVSASNVNAPFDIQKFNQGLLNAPANQAGNNVNADVFNNNNYPGAPLSTQNSTAVNMTQSPDKLKLNPDGSMNPNQPTPPNLDTKSPLNDSYGTNPPGTTYGVPSAGSTLPDSNGNYIPSGTTPTIPGTNPTGALSPSLGGGENGMSNLSQTSPYQPVPIKNATLGNNIGGSSTQAANDPNTLFNTNVQNLTNYGAGQESPQVTTARNNLQNLQNEYQKKYNNIQGTAGFLTQANGEESLLHNQYLTALDAAQTALTSALSSQGQQIGAANNAGNLASPVGQFGMLTNPLNGQPLNTGMFSTAVNQATQLVQSGADPQGQAVQALLQPFGFVGQSAFTAAQQAVNQNYNPTSQSGAVQQNVAQGTNSQGQAYALNLGLQQLKALQPVVTNFLSASGINPFTSPLYNSPVNTYISQLGNPGAATQYQYMLNDLSKFASQMLSAGAGGTPTGTQAATDLMDPSKLSMAQIQSALNTLDTLGTNQVSVLQNQSAASLGGNVGQYAGNPAKVTSSTPVASPGTSIGSGITDPYAQMSSGVNLQVAGVVGSALKDFGGEVLGAIGGKMLGV